MEFIIREKWNKEVSKGCRFGLLADGHMRVAVRFVFYDRDEKYAVYYK